MKIVMRVLLLAAITYVALLASLIAMFAVEDYPAMFVIGVVFVVVGNMVCSLLIYGVLYQILERLKQ